MTAYESIRYEDLMQRVQVRNEVLTEKEQRQLNHLDAIARKEWEDQEAPHWLGGDYPDVF